MPSPVPQPQARDPYQNGYDAGVAAQKNGKVDLIFFDYLTEKYKKGYKAGVAFEKNFRNQCINEARAAQRIRRAKQIEIIKKAREIKQAKDQEARRIKRAVEKAHTDAIEFHKALDYRDVDRKLGASDPEIRASFGSRRSFAEISRCMEVHGPRAKVDQGGGVEGEEESLLCQSVGQNKH